MPLQFHDFWFHVEIDAIEWHDFQRETQFHGVVVAWIEFSLDLKSTRLTAVPNKRLSCQPDTAEQYWILAAVACNLLLHRFALFILVVAHLSFKKKKL